MLFGCCVWEWVIGVMMMWLCKVRLFMVSGERSRLDMVFFF